MFYDDFSKVPGFDDVPSSVAEELARDWGFDETSDAWGAMVGWAAGLLHDGSDDEW